MRSFLDRSTTGGISFFAHGLGVSLLSRVEHTSLVHSRSSYAVSTCFQTSAFFKSHALTIMTSSTRRLHTHNSDFSSHKVLSDPSFPSASAHSANRIHPSMSANILRKNPQCEGTEISTPHNLSPAALQEDLTKPSKDVPYTPSEVCALLLLLLPESAAGAKSISVKTVLQQFPTEMREMVLKHPGGLACYVKDHFPQSIDVTADGAALLRMAKSPQSESSDSQNTLPQKVTKPISLSPPPPPRPSATLAETTHPFSDAASGSAVLGQSPQPNTLTNATTATRRFRSTVEVLDALVEYIPTFFVSGEAIASMLPPEILALYTDTSLVYFLKRFKHYLDVRTTFGQTKIRLKEDFLHPKRGIADARYATGSESVRGAESRRRPPRNSEANLLLSLLPRVPKEFRSFAEVLQEISDIVSRHPAFDPRLGVMGLLEKYPEYFQVAEGKLRVRPYSVAPNALDELDGASSPFPLAFAKMMKLVDSVAEGKSYHDDNDRALASVSTSKLYSMLSDRERSDIRAACRSFLRFLRLHGKAIVVSSDNMRVYKFKPEYEHCAETLLNTHLSEMELSPDDPVLVIPATMDENTKADWVLRELYNTLPLMQCAELEDLLVLVPDAVREALPRDINELVSMLSEFPDYFDTWPYPDDPSVVIIQRAKVGIPVYEKEEIIKKVLPLIPQGGIKLSTLKSRAPLPLQRYFYRYGVSKTLGEMDQLFSITNDCIIRVS